MFAMGSDDAYLEGDQPDEPKNRSGGPGRVRRRGRSRGRGRRLASIRGRPGVRNRVEIAAWAWEIGLTQPVIGRQPEKPVEAASPRASANRHLARAAVDIAWHFAPKTLVVRKTVLIRADTPSPAMASN